MFEQSPLFNQQKRVGDTDPFSQDYIILLFDYSIGSHSLQP